jgi:chitin synthase
MSYPYPPLDQGDEEQQYHDNRYPLNDIRGPTPSYPINQAPPPQSYSHSQLPTSYSYDTSYDPAAGDPAQQYGYGQRPLSPPQPPSFPLSQSMPLPVHHHSQQQQQPYYDVHGQPNFPHSSTNLAEQHDPFHHQEDDNLGAPLLQQNQLYESRRDDNQTQDWQSQLANRRQPSNYSDGGGGQDYDQRSENQVTYGRIPQRQPRRYKTIKRVNLYHGNLVLDCQVPPKFLERLPKKDEREFTHMR